VPRVEVLAELSNEICTATAELWTNNVFGEGRDGALRRPFESGRSLDTARLAVAPYPAAAGPAVQPYLVTLGTCPGHSLMGTQQVAWLCFTAVTNQSSAFLSLQLGESIGTQPDGTLVTNYLSQAGRVVVGQEPLLEAVIATNGQPQLILYGLVGTTNTIQVNPDLGNATGWQPACQVTLTNLWQTFACEGVTNRTLFYRARKL
jgi:hypothetical protein